MAELMRGAALSGYVRTMAAFGVDPRPLLEEYGLSAELLANPEQLIPARAAIRLLERSAERTGCITLGLRLAEGRSLGNLGATGLLIEHQPDLRAVLAALGEFRGLVNSTLLVHVEEGADEAILRVDFSLRRPEVSRQASNLIVGVLARLCAGVLGEAWTPRIACFSHAAPAKRELQVFARVFRCPLQFGCDFNGLVIASNDLSRANPKADAQLAGHARSLLAVALRPAGSTAAQDVEQLIKLLLPAGRASVQACAASLGMTVRTLQRLLDAEGETFSTLLNRVRMQLATQYLANPRMRVTDVADALGYASIGAFTRWHTQAFGMSPRRMRAPRAVTA